MTLADPVEKNDENDLKNVNVPKNNEEKNSGSKGLSRLINYTSHDFGWPCRESTGSTTWGCRGPRQCSSSGGVCWGWGASGPGSCCGALGTATASENRE